MPSGTRAYGNLSACLATEAHFFVSFGLLVGLEGANWVSEGPQRAPKKDPKMIQNRAPEAPKTLLEPGCRWKLVSEPFLVLFGTPRDPENHALAVARCYFC